VKVVAHFVPSSFVSDLLRREALPPLDRCLLIPLPLLNCAQFSFVTSASLRGG